MFLFREGMQDSYGPAILFVMEYTASMYGIHMEHETIYWGTIGGYESLYEQLWENHYKKYGYPVRSLC